MRKVKFWAAACVLVLLLIRPETAVAGAQRAMQIWCAAVAPALFPFLALMPLLTGEEACCAYEKMFSVWMRPLFRLSGSSAPAVIIGMIAGSPGGALTLKRVAGNAGMTKREAKIIAFALGGVSPAYLIMGVGQGLYGSAMYGIQLAAIQLGLQIMLLFLYSRLIQEDEEELQVDIRQELRNTVGSAVESLLAICGYMVLFSSIAAVMASFVGETAGTGMLLLMDLPSGLARLAAIGFPEKMVIQGAAIGLSGFCIMMQNMDTLKTLGIRWREYLSARLVAAVLFACACAAMEYLPGSGTGMPLEGNKTYAFSLLAAAVAVIPTLFLLSKKLFLNNRKNVKESG